MATHIDRCDAHLLYELPCHLGFRGVTSRDHYAILDTVELFAAMILYLLSVNSGQYDGTPLINALTWRLGDSTEKDVVVVLQIEDGNKSVPVPSRVSAVNLTSIHAFRHQLPGLD